MQRESTCSLDILVNLYGEDVSDLMTVIGSSYHDVIDLEFESDSLEYGNHSVVF